MNAPPLSSCQYTSQMLKMRKPSAEKNRRKKRNGWRPASSMYCRRHSSRAAFSSAVMGRVGTSPQGVSSHFQSETSAPFLFMGRGDGYLIEATPACHAAESIPQQFMREIIA